MSAPDFVREFKPALFFDSFTEPRRTLCVDRRPSEAAILAQMKPKGRYNIRLAQRHNVSIVEDTSGAGLADFQTIYEDMTERQQIDTKPPEYFETLISIFAEQKNASIFFAEHQGLRLAAALIIYCGTCATYFFGASLEAKRNVMAPYLLHFEIMRRAKAMGFEEYDLWGVAPENEPNDSWYDISVFKRKFGGREVNLIPPLDYVYEPEAYDIYIAGESSREETCPDEEMEEEGV